MSKSPVTTEEPIPTKFEDLNLIPPLLQAVKRMGYKTASPIQAQLIPTVPGTTNRIPADWLRKQINLDPSTD